MTKTGRRWTLALVLLAGTVAGAAYVQYRGPEVAVTAVARGPVVQALVVSGRVLAPAEIDLGSSVLARVQSVAVDVGDRVEEGQALLSLDDAEALAQEAEAEANERRALAGIRQLRRVTSSIAGDELESARVRLQDAEEEVARMRTLVRSGATPPTRLDDAVRARDLAQAQLQSAATRSSSARPGGAASALAAAQLAQAEAALVAARARLAQTTVRAPVAGVILRRHVDPGVVLSPGQASLTLLADGKARLVVEPDESHLSLLAVGRLAIASADAFPTESFVATVSWIAPAIDPDRGTVEVRLDVEEPPDYLRADMTVSVDIEVGRTESTLVVPRNSVGGALTDAPYVLVTEGGRVVRRAVELGLRGDEFFEVTEGLDEGDLVVSVLDEAIAAGDRIRPLVAPVASAEGP